jgi:hypothetical protein
MLYFRLINDLQLAEHLELFGGKCITTLSGCLKKRVLKFNNCGITGYTNDELV